VKDIFYFLALMSLQTRMTFFLLWNTKDYIFKKLSNQPITWQLFQCIPGQDNLLNSKLNVRVGKKGDLSNFERGMVVGV